MIASLKVLRRIHRLALLILLGSLLPAYAGMTVITVTDLAKARLESISFFCLTYFLLAWGVQGLWNYLAKAFPSMPKINYRRALALMLVSGLFLYVILTMISGARELMTPGAWKKQGIGYELSGDTKLPSKKIRKASMQSLKSSLWAHANENDGKLPSNIFDKSFKHSNWALPKIPGYYAYLGDKEIGGNQDILAYEPSVMGQRRFVLLTDGSIEAWSESELTKALRDE